MKWLVDIPFLYGFLLDLFDSTLLWSSPNAQGVYILNLWDSLLIDIVNLACIYVVFFFPPLQSWNPENFYLHI